MKIEVLRNGVSLIPENELESDVLKQWASLPVRTESRCDRRGEGVTIKFDRTLLEACVESPILDIKGA